MHADVAREIVVLSINIWLMQEHAEPSRARNMPSSCAGPNHTFTASTSWLTDLVKVSTVLQRKHLCMAMRRTGWLHANDFNAGMQRLYVSSDSRNQASAADGDEHGLQAAQLRASQLHARS